MHTETEIYGVLTTIFEEIFSRDDIVLRADTSAKDIEGWDSFTQIEIIMSIEQQLQIKMTTRELDNLHNVGDLVRVIAGKLG